MEQGKSIKQIADEIGVSKQAVRDKIAKLGLHGTLHKIGNQLCILKIQENLIKSSFIENQSQSENAKQLCDNDDESQTTLQLISMLQKELDMKNKQIDSQQLIIQELTATVKSQAQSINVDRHLELAEKIEEQVPKLIEDIKPKKKWWKR